MSKDEVALRFLQRRLKNGYKLTSEQEKALKTLEAGFSMYAPPQARPVAKRRFEETAARLVTLNSVKRSKSGNPKLPAKKDIPMRTLRQPSSEAQDQGPLVQSTSSLPPQWLEITRSLDHTNQSVITSSEKVDSMSWEPLPPRLNRRVSKS